ncbi:ATP-dependent endonuclease [Porphyromonas gingivalis]|uniref:ATP-dependent endonuclease n=1 Tax=Porphyromonas gingivalis TaxID=837 RepID=UPI0009750621|nr:ATP-dependent endonuclease [Porphyromonas gingivalis]SJL29796.1 recombination protein F [Porphyromonas gingivalis]
MKIQSVQIRNFRKLKNCHIDFGEKETVFVGANNSGKTSAISAIVWFLKNNEKFTLREFTATNWVKINNLGDQWLTKDSVDAELLDAHEWDNIVPSMDIWINVEDGEQYRVNHLIPSLNTWDGKKVGVRGQYVPKDVKKLYVAYREAKKKAQELQSTEEWKKASSPELFPKNLSEFLGKGSNLRDYFDVKYYIIDSKIEPDDDKVQPTPDNALDKNPLEELIRVDAILASRDFSDPDGHSDSEIDTLSRQFQRYYSNSNPEEEILLPGDLELVSGIAKANETYNAKLTKTFETPVAELRGINYPGFQNPEIKICSRIQIEEAIKHDSAVQFAIQGLGELALPEKYNGLGYRNLISIYLKLMDFREKWLKTSSERENIEPIHLVFVEEPEAHLHAQAQQVFVKKAFEALCNNKIIKDNSWLNTQLVLSTHSNHIVNELDLNCMRYFRRVIGDAGDKIPVSDVINLSNTFGPSDETKQFVTRYIRLTHCDMFFADAVILVEGPAEKILVPSFLAKAGLDSFYISVVEVNGRHAHSFRSLINKIGIPTLIVTDIDATEAVEEEGKAKYKAVITTQGKGYKTGNPSIRNWLPDKELIDDLITLDGNSKTVDNVRIAFQTPIKINWTKEKDEYTEICPYTFEDALIFSNLELFRQDGLKKMGTITTIANLLQKNHSAEDLQKSIFEKLESKGGFQKADFANSLLYKEDFCKMNAPAYIQEGLEWLKKCLDSNE